MINESNEADRNFDVNLGVFGQHVSAPPGISARGRAQGLETFERIGHAPRRMLRGLFGRPALFSTIGLAAALVLVVGLFFPTGGGPTIQAAVVLEKLATQVQGDDVLEVKLENIGADGATVNARLQVSNDAIAGDVRAAIQENASDPPIEIDASLALSKHGAWVLIRKLSVPTEPEFAAILNGFFPPGTDTLLSMSEETAGELLQEASDVDLTSALAELRAVARGQLVTFIKGVIESQGAVGAVLTYQSDGTVLISITVRDAESLRKLAEIAAKAMGKTADGDLDIDDDDARELVGCKLNIVYDPTSETVRSFSISDVGEMTGRITISLIGGAIDPALLDQTRVVTPNTRVLDINALINMAKAFIPTHDENE